MKASVDFDHGIFTLTCSKCRRKHVKRISEANAGLRLRCKCGTVLSWVGDLNWVACYARPYNWTTQGPSPIRAPFKALK